MGGYGVLGRMVKQKVVLLPDCSWSTPSRREHSKVPYIVRQCLEEIERRGMEEVGIYRVSGVATDIQALKAAFDASERRLHSSPTQAHPQLTFALCSLCRSLVSYPTCTCYIFWFCI